MNNTKTMQTESTIKAYQKLDKSIYSALETYSNVHRSSGFNSTITTALYEKARKAVLSYLGLNGSYTVIFGSARRINQLVEKIASTKYKILKSNNFGLSLGINALVIKKNALPKIPNESGGGTARLTAKDWVLWSIGNDKYEAGTPAIINVLAFTAALNITKQLGKDVFKTNTNNFQVFDILYHDNFANLKGGDLLEELRKTHVGKNVKVPTTRGETTFTNLDNSASTPTFEPVYQTFVNSMHQQETLSNGLVHETKKICSTFLNAPQSDYDIFFTSNTTESVNIAADSFSKAQYGSVEPVILSTYIEHSSNDLPWRNLESHNFVRLKTNANGLVDLHELEKVLREYNHDNKFSNKRVQLLTITGASNVLGTCNNLPAISEIVHKYGAKLMVDAAQLIAHREIRMHENGIDFLAFSAHKIYAPFGTGVLIARKGLLNFNDKELDEICKSGEENVAGIAALGKSMVLLSRIGMNTIAAEEKRMTSLLLWKMAKVAGVTIHGVSSENDTDFDKKLGVVIFEIQKVMANQVAKKLSQHFGIGVRYGCHCAHVAVKQVLNVSPGLEKFQKIMLTLLPKVQLPGVTRVSLGLENDENDIEKFALAIEAIAQNNTNQNNQTVTSSSSEVKKLINKAKDTVSKKVFSVYTDGTQLCE